MPIDLQQAGVTFLALEKLFAAHPEGKLGRACRRELRNIEIYGALLSSSESEAPRAAAFVRMRVRRALAALGSRLEFLAFASEKPAVGVNPYTV